MIGGYRVRIELRIITRHEDDVCDVRAGMELPTNLLSCVNKTATPASTLPTVRDTNILEE
jgi:hypothetical protein